MLLLSITKRWTETSNVQHRVFINSFINLLACDANKKDQGYEWNLKLDPRFLKNMSKKPSILGSSFGCILILTFGTINSISRFLDFSITKKMNRNRLIIYLVAALLHACRVVGFVRSDHVIFLVDPKKRVRYFPTINNVCFKYNRRMNHVTKKLEHASVTLCA